MKNNSYLNKQINLILEFDKNYLKVGALVGAASGIGRAVGQTVLNKDNIPVNYTPAIGHGVIVGLASMLGIYAYKQFQKADKDKKIEILHSKLNSVKTDKERSILKSELNKLQNEQ